MANRLSAGQAAARPDQDKEIFILLHLAKHKSVTVKMADDRSMERLRVMEMCQWPKNPT